MKNESVVTLNETELRDLITAHVLAKEGPSREVYRPQYKNAGIEFASYQTPDSMGTATVNVAVHVRDKERGPMAEPAKCSETETANRLREAVAKVNELAADAIAAGLSVTYDTLLHQEVGKPDGDFLQVKVSRVL